MAEVFMQSGDFFWNSGMFFWSLKYHHEGFYSIIFPRLISFSGKGSKFYNTEKEAEFIGKVYPNCKNISIDYGIMEKAENVFVLCSDFGWSDLGTWGSLYDMLDKDDDQNSDYRIQCFYLQYPKLPDQPAG